MAKIEVGRYSELFRRFLELKGTEEVTGELSPEISAVFLAEGDRTDWKVLKGEKLLSVTMEEAGVLAGPTMRLRNPEESGMVATISHVSLTLSGTADVYVISETLLTGDLVGGVLAAQTRDARRRGSTFSISFGDVAPAGGRLWIGIVAVDFTQIVKFPIVIIPGRALDIGTTGVQAGTNRVAVQWSERRLPTLEEL